MRLRPGTPYPLGASWDGEGVNFALFSEHATRVELCLFDAPDDPIESARIVLLVNGGDRSRAFTLPRLEGPGSWHQEIDTARPGSRAVRSDAITLVAHSLVLLRHGER